MKKIIKLFTWFMLFITLTFFSAPVANASSFRRKKKRVPKSDSYYGKNWSKMDGDLDRLIDGPGAKVRRKRKNKNKTRFQKKR